MILGLCYIIVKAFTAGEVYHPIEVRHLHFINFYYNIKEFFL